MARQFLATLSLPTLSNHPTDGHAGSLYFNTSMNALMMHTGTDWMPVNGSQYTLEDHIHTYDGPIHTIIAGSGFNPSLTIFDGGNASSVINSDTDINGGSASGN
jgi:hypothetical protein